MKQKSLPSWILAVILALAFFAAGGTKLIGLEMHVENFARWGYAPWFMYVTGLVEVGSAILVLIPLTRLWGAMMLICVMIGATGTHLLHDEANMLAAPITLGVLAAVLTFLEWGSRKEV